MTVRGWSSPVGIVIRTGRGACSVGVREGVVLADARTNGDRRLQTSQVRRCMDDDPALPFR